MDTVQITVPFGGVIPNTTDMNGSQVAAHVLVKNASGAVSISNLFVGNEAPVGVSGCPPLFAGIFYQNSSGTVNRVVDFYPEGNHCGIGIWIEGGSSNPAVTVEDSYVAGYDEYGIYVETYNHLPTELKATVSSNFVRDGSPGCSAAIGIGEGATATVKGNVIQNNSGHSGLDTSCGSGLVTLSNAVGSISSNTVHWFPVGVRVIADGVSVTSNTFLEVGTGVELHTAVPAIKNNIIINSTLGIEFNCEANPNVLSNTINADAGLDFVPVGVTTTNKFFNVVNIRQVGDTC
jgi:hypothetical protein